MKGFIFGIVIDVLLLVAIGLGYILNPERATPFGIWLSSLLGGALVVMIVVNIIGIWVVKNKDRISVALSVENEEAPIPSKTKAELNELLEDALAAREQPNARQAARQQTRKPAAPPKQKGWL